MRPQWRDLPDERTPRDLTHAVMSRLNDIDDRVREMDEPTTQRGAEALEEINTLVQTGRDRCFRLIEKQKQVEAEVEALTKAKSRLLRERQGASA